MSLVTNLQTRAKVVSAIRSFFERQNFLEVETPLLVPQPSTEPYLEVFQTTLTTSRGQSRQAFLTTSPEYAMKKLLSMGVGSCFQICKSFRNQEESFSQSIYFWSITFWYCSNRTFNSRIFRSKFCSWDYTSSRC